MQTLAAILIIVATVLVMEFVAWSSHKYIMHGFGWGWHRDHHEPHAGFFEKNDLYAVVGAAISISFFMLGSPLVMGADPWWPATFIGLGVMAYGAIYTLVH
ncbi:MAG: beta-carotene hydroxylase, partial [Novosphingobium sp.]